jgi:hypothetical protein
LMEDDRRASLTPMIAEHDSRYLLMIGPAGEQ